MNGPKCCRHRPGVLSRPMVNVTSPEEWWGNLSEETQDRLATNPGGPVPGDLWAEVVAANTGTDLHPPFRSIEDHVLRGTFVAYIQGDNEALLASIAANSGVSPFPRVEEWKMRARRRGLIG